MWSGQVVGIYTTKTENSKMRKKALVYLSFVLGLVITPLFLQGQIAKIEPENPQWGEIANVTYDPSAEGAVFLPGDEVYIFYNIQGERSTAQKWKKLNKAGGVFSCDLPIEKGMSFLSIYFISLESWDRNAGLATMIYRKEGVPARRANEQKMLTVSHKEYLDCFYQERSLYPDNYSVFRTKWFLQGGFDKENLIASVKQDMKMLAAKITESTDELLFSLSYGYMLLDNEPAARKILQTMADKFPLSFYTGYAFRNYDYQVFSKQLQGEGPEEVKNMKKKLLKLYPDSQFARDNVIAFKADEEVTLETIDLICESWIKDEPENPMPFFMLADTYAQRGAELKKALELVSQGIKFLLQGKLRFYQDITGFMTQMYLPVMYKLRADLHLKVGNISDSLADIKTAQALQKEARPDYFDTEAEVWMKIGYFQKAEKALLEALRIGSKEAEGSLKEIYKKRHSTLDGFDDYLDEAVKKEEPEDSTGKKTAPEFDVKTLDGKSLRLSDLKGKVLVLNFWFIGCAPCRVEMPGLNILTAEFKGEDVVFIAFATDGAEALKKFLETKEFKYQIVPGAEKIAELYGVEVFPTHVIINKQGQIEFFMTGGSKDRHEQLRPLIKNLLR